MSCVNIGVENSVLGKVSDFLAFNACCKLSLPDFNLSSFSPLRFILNKLGCLRQHVESLQAEPSSKKTWLKFLNRLTIDSSWYFLE